MPTVQLVGLITNVLSLTAKGMPDLPSHLLVACVGASLTGIGAGQFLARYLPEAAARRTVIALAIAGSVIAIGKGVAAIW